VNYKKIALKLIQDLPFITSIAIVKRKGRLLFSTDNWNIKADLSRIIDAWKSNNIRSIKVSGLKYSIINITNEKIIATSTKGKGHIVGAKDDKHKIIVHIEPDGLIIFAYLEMLKILSYFRKKKTHIKKKEKLGQRKEIGKKFSSFQKFEKEKKFNIDKVLENKSYLKQDILDENAGIPFTARLMAHYRYQESKRENPLLIDPFAKKLAGNLTSYLKNHIRYSEMDYPIIRSHYIEDKLIIPWCKKNEKSQIVLLGAGLDTRAYRLKSLQTNTHTIFEVDFPTIIKYKKEHLREKKPLCNLIRISTDLSNPIWISHLIEKNFIQDVPTFWILEGLVYYIEKQDAKTLIREIAKLSMEKSEIFVDIMQISRWSSILIENESNNASERDIDRSLKNFIANPYSKHLKWGIDIKNIPSFFLDLGWNVSCSWADEHDQGRDVGQKGMIFVEGTIIIKNG